MTDLDELKQQIKSMDEQELRDTLAYIVGAANYLRSPGPDYRGEADPHQWWTLTNAVSSTLNLRRMTQ